MPPASPERLVVAVYYRTDLSMRQLGPTTLETAACARVRLPLGPVGADRWWIVDGCCLGPGPRPAPGRAQPKLPALRERSGHRGADTRLMIAAACPVPGTITDAHAWRAPGLSEHCQGVTLLGDGANLHCGLGRCHTADARAGLYCLVRRTISPSTVRSAPMWKTSSAASRRRPRHHTPGRRPYARPPLAS